MGFWHQGSSVLAGTAVLTRDHSVYRLSQWNTALQCNAVSHWPSPYTERSLWPSSQLPDHNIQDISLTLLHSPIKIYRSYIWTWFNNSTKDRYLSYVTTGGGLWNYLFITFFFSEKTYLHLSSMKNRQLNWPTAITKRQNNCSCTRIFNSPTIETTIVVIHE